MKKRIFKKKGRKHYNVVYLQAIRKEHTNRQGGESGTQIKDIRDQHKQQPSRRKHHKCWKSWGWQTEEVRFNPDRAVREPLLNQHQKLNQAEKQPVSWRDRGPRRWRRHLQETACFKASRPQHNRWQEEPTNRHIEPNSYITTPQGTLQQLILKMTSTENTRIVKQNYKNPALIITSPSRAVERGNFFFKEQDRTPVLHICALCLDSGV